VFDDYRYVESDHIHNQRQYFLSSFSSNEYIEKIISYSTNGKTLGELASYISSIAGVGQTEAIAFSNELIDAQILTSDLEPSVTGIEPFEQLISKLEKIKSGDDKILKNLLKIQNDILSKRRSIDFYKGIVARLNDSIDGVAIESDVALQVDMFLTAKSANIQKEILEDILSQINELEVFSLKIENTDMEQFMNRFQLKYETEEVPLVVALDNDLGVGYSEATDNSIGDNSIIDDLAINQRPKQDANEIENRFNFIQHFALEKYNESIRKNDIKIEIKEEELQLFAEKSKEYSFPNSMAIMGSLFSRNGRLDIQNYCFNLKGISGPSAGNLFARFAHGNSEIKDFTREILQAEEDESEEVIYAEIIHLPESRVGNILLRPILRKYEIPYGGISGIDKEFQIPITDLTVSIRNKEVILRSRKFNKIIIPRLTTAHNYSTRTLPIYKFLCDVQKQGYYQQLWDWGVLNSSACAFLPRVVYKSLILSRAQWKIKVADIKGQITWDNDAKFVRWSEQIRNRTNMPRHVVMTSGDNELLLDMDNLLNVKILVQEIEKKQSVLLQEFLFENENCIVKDVNGNGYVNELIIPVKRKSSRTVNMAIANDQLILQRKFHPYTEWLYFRVYIGTKSTDKFLLTVLLPFVEKGEREGLFEKFFFIRYKDEFPHVRIRFYNKDTSKQYELSLRFMQSIDSFISNGAIHNVELGTYEREIERYSPLLMELTETIFYYDSTSVLQILRALQHTSSKRKMLIALRAIVVFLDDFHIDLDRRLAIFTRVQNDFFHEFGGSPHLQKQLNSKYRQFQNDIESFIDKKNDQANDVLEVISILTLRSLKQRELIGHILAHESEYESNLIHYIHMFMNRLFTSQQRKFELLIYHFLNKYYNSQLARQRTVHQ
jgi:lantibiotic biosynthesis protein